MGEVANSYLNWLWWLIEPIGTMGVYYIVFGIFFQSMEEHYATFIFIGISLWNFFSGNILMGINIMRAYKALISNVYIPKYVLVLSNVFVSAFKMVLALGLTVVFMFIGRIRVGKNILFTLPVIVVFFVITYGLTLVFTHFGVYIRDLFDATRIVLQMVMYVSGVFYSLPKLVPQPYGSILEKINPIAYLIGSFRNALIYNMAPNLMVLAFWFAVGIALLMAGFYLIDTYESEYVKVI